MKIESLKIADVKLVTPKRFADERGYFSEIYNQQAFEAQGIAAKFVQDNQSFSAKQATLRGLHYQAPPFAQAKLIRVLRGSVLDVVVDARRASPTFGGWVSSRLSADDGTQLFVPAGFLHGFVTLEPNTEVAYKVDAFYDRASDGAVRWDDPDLGVDWGVDAADVVVSDKDRRAQSWAAFDSPF